MAFGMNDMLADMLRKAIPAEVMEMLTAEKLKEIGDKANAFVTDIRTSLDFIKQQNETTHELLQALLEKASDDNVAVMGAIKEGFENVSNGSQRQSRKRAGSGDASGDANAN